jgi:hypothetical protein
MNKKDIIEIDKHEIMAYNLTIDNLRLDIEIYRKALQDIIHEVGIPSCNYPENIINVYKIAKNTIDENENV